MLPSEKNIEWMILVWLIIIYNNLNSEKVKREITCGEFWLLLQFHTIIHLLLTIMLFYTILFLMD